MNRLVSRREQLSQGQLEIIDAIYGAVLHRDRWADLVTSLTKILGGYSAILVRAGTPRRTECFLASGLDPAFEKSYVEHFAGLNPWETSTGGIRAPVVANDESIGDGVLERGEFYADWCRPQGDLRYTINIHAIIGPERSLEIVDTRHRRNGPFDEDERNLMLSIIPHLERAAQLQSRLEVAEATRAASERVFTRFGTGMLLVDATSRVLFMDAQAERILEACDELKIRNGRLVEAAVGRVRLSEAIRRATGGGTRVVGRTGAQIMLPSRSGQEAVAIAVSPLDERDRPMGLVGPLAMVTVSGRERHRGLDHAAVQTLLGLTPAEGRLVAALCDGMALGAYAQANEISLNTAKTHLKHVFEKTGVSRQADLVRRVINDRALRSI